MINHATIPSEVRAHVIGPRLAATMSYLSGRFHLSKRSVKEFVEAVFDVPVSLGTVAALEQQTSAALASAHDQARDAVRDVRTINPADRSGWPGNFLASRSWWGRVAMPMISAHASGLAIGAASRASSQTAIAVASTAMMLRYIFLSIVVTFVRREGEKTSGRKPVINPIKGRKAQT